MSLDVEFRKLWHDLGMHGEPTEVYSWLKAQYSGPDRHYHTLNHIEYGLRAIDKLSEPLAIDGYEKQLFDRVRFAFWFHDCLPTEQRSADVARFVCWTGRKTEHCNSIENFIKLTTHKTEPIYVSQRVMVDADLAIFAADEEKFDEYEALVRKEYPNVPEGEYRPVRKSILESFLNRKSIYYTIYAQREWEQIARENLKRSIEKLV